MREKNINKKKILKELTEQDQRRNITFSLPPALIEEFKKECKKHNKKMNTVIKKMMEDFIKE